MQLSLINTLIRFSRYSFWNLTPDMLTRHDICPHVTYDTVYSDMFLSGSYCTDAPKILPGLKVTSTSSKLKSIFLFDLNF